MGAVSPSTVRSDGIMVLPLAGFCAAAARPVRIGFNERLRRKTACHGRARSWPLPGLASVVSLQRHRLFVFNLRADQPLVRAVDRRAVEHAAAEMVTVAIGIGVFASGCGDQIFLFGTCATNPCFTSRCRYLTGEVVNLKF